MSKLKGGKCKDIIVRTSGGVMKEWERSMMDLYLFNDTAVQVERLLRSMTKTELSRELGISRPTLDSRIAGSSKWKVLEVKWISSLSRK